MKGHREGVIHKEAILIWPISWMHQDVDRVSSNTRYYLFWKGLLTPGIDPL